ncbi:MAG: hypothetical protein DWH83_07475 [Planctomycetota bacterium]|nr:MAG: hypothetical protein DWH83_07475 [Planctomycetota bacterium]
MTRTTDVIIVGGGIMGLAFAWEAAVLAEFATRAPDQGVPCELLPGAEAVRRFPAIAPDARAVLWSPTEVAVDPPRAIAAVAAHLQRMHGVDTHFSTTGRRDRNAASDHVAGRAVRGSACDRLRRCRLRNAVSRSLGRIGHATV